MSSKVFRWLLWLAIAFTLVMALLPKPPELPGDPGDKVQHVMAFLTLTVLTVLAYPGVRLVTIFIALSGFGVLIELLQMIPALNRDAQWEDWLADSAAVLAVLALAVLVRRIAVRR
ncbi:MAG: hypothetical protein M0R03_09835 [Novosphingobium sp.]|nr:hypothetical protein [Novosphingobium sp.]